MDIEKVKAVELWEWAGPHPSLLTLQGRQREDPSFSLPNLIFLFFHLSQLVSDLCKDEDLDNPGQTDGTIIYAAYYYINSTVVKNRSSVWLY